MIKKSNNTNQNFENLVSYTLEGVEYMIPVGRESRAEFAHASCVINDIDLMYSSEKNRLFADEIKQIAYFAVKAYYKQDDVFVDVFVNDYDGFVIMPKDESLLQKDKNGYVYAYGRKEIYPNGITEDTPKYLPCAKFNEIETGVTDFYRWYPYTKSSEDKSESRFFPDYKFIKLNNGEKIFFDENNKFVSDGLTHIVLFNNFTLMQIGAENIIGNAPIFTFSRDANNEYKLYKLTDITHIDSVVSITEYSDGVYIDGGDRSPQESYTTGDNTITLNDKIYYELNSGERYYWDGENEIISFVCEEITDIENLYPLIIESEHTFNYLLDDIGTLSNTKIYGDGTVFLKKLIVENGDYSGSINADGLFKGELQVDGGSFKNVDAHVKSLHGTITFNENDIVSAQKNGASFFEITQTNLSSAPLDTINYLSEYSRSVVNSNGTDSGQRYHSNGRINLCSFIVKNGGTLTIDNITGYLNRFAPKKRCNESSTCSIIVTYDGVDKYKQTIDFEKFWGEGKSYKNFTISSIVANETMSKDTIVDIYLSYNIHLSTYYYWFFGLDKASFSFKINKTKCTIKYPKQTSGLYIAPNGLKLITNGGIDASLYGDKIWLCVNGNGIAITKDGMKTVQNNKII